MGEQARAARAAQQFPVRYFRIDSQPLFSRCRRSSSALHECEYLALVRSPPSLRPVNPRPFRHPSRPILCSSVTETLAQETNKRGAKRCAAQQSTAEQSEAERSGAERGETDFQMDINSSACSTPRSSLITAVTAVILD